MTPTATNNGSATRPPASNAPGAAMAALGSAVAAPPPRRKKPTRSERIRLVALEALHRRGLAAMPATEGGPPAPPPLQARPPTSAPSLNPNALPFTAPPALLPPEIRKNLQGDQVPQVPPSS